MFKIKLIPSFALLLILSTLTVFGQAVLKPKAPSTINGGVINGKAKSLPAPAYPEAARAVHVEGTVKVQVLIDENGDIVSAVATSGDELLRASAVEAAKQAKFTPTKLSGQPVKVSGVIVYNFVTNDGVAEIRKKEEETLKPFALALLLTLMKEVRTEANPAFSDADAKELTPTADDIATDFPNLKQELSPLISLKTSSREKRIEVAGQVFAAVEAKLSGDDAWRFELSKNFGGSFALILNSADEEKGFDFNLFDASGFKTYLQKARDLTYSAPPETPTLLLEKFKDLANFGEKSFESPENLKLYAEKVAQFMDDFDPNKSEIAK